MANREIISKLQFLRALASTAIGSNTTTAGSIIDTKGYDSVAFIIHGHTLTDGTYTPLINESDDSGMSGETAVADSDLFVPGVTSGQEAEAALEATDDNTVKKIAYTGSKRYITCDIVSTGTTSGGTVSVIAVLGSPNNAPIAQN